MTLKNQQFENVDSIFADDGFRQWRKLCVAFFQNKYHFRQRLKLRKKSKINWW